MSRIRSSPWISSFIVGWWLPMLASSATLPSSTSDACPEFFGFLYPITFSEAACRRLDEGRVVFRFLPGDRDEIALLGATAIEATAESMRDHVHDISELKKSERVLAIGRFSSPPSIEDLSELQLDQADVEDLTKCRAGDCPVKLSAPEIEVLQGVLESSDGTGNTGVQQAFRTIVLERVRSYLEGGLEALPPYCDSDTPVSLQAAFASTLSNLPFLYRGAPRFAAYLEHYPNIDIPEVESFLYWSKEQLGRKPSIAVTHVAILAGRTGRGEPEILVAGKQIFSTHYTNGSIGLTMVFRGEDRRHNYLVYVNRSKVDFLGGFWGPLVRALVEGRIEAAATGLIRGLRERLEEASPDPNIPAASVSSDAGSSRASRGGRPLLRVAEQRLREEDGHRPLRVSPTAGK